MTLNGPVLHYMTPEFYLAQTASSNLYCYVQVVEETTLNLNFWLLGDNFLRGYYQVYDMANKQIGLASSKFIANGSFSFNNSVVYVPPPDPVNPIVIAVNKIMGMDSSDFTIVLIVVCGGGSFLLISIGVCIYCYVKIRNKKRLDTL